MEAKTQKVSYEYFRGSFITWANLFAKAAEFATEIGRENLILKIIIMP